MTKKILMTVGGTGGHVYPALALAKQLLEVVPGLELHFAGGKLDSNRYFNEKSFPIHSTSCAFLNSKNPFKLILNGFSIAQGFWQSHQILRSFRPDLVVGFGSYHTFPTLLAAKWAGFPIVLHEANSIPGKVNRYFAPYAKATGIHFPITASLLKGTTVEVGMPLREGFRHNLRSKKEARAHYQLHPAKTTLLIFGGSQGAQAINRLIIEALNYHPQLFREQLQVIHIAGTQEAVERIRGGYLHHRIDACVKDFEPRMDLAWEAADFFVGRAGAGTIAEAMEFETPGILIPFPRAADGHQDKNADFMAQVVGGAEVYIEKELTAEILSQAVASYLNINKLSRLRDAIQRYKQIVRRKDFCTLIRTML